MADPDMQTLEDRILLWLIPLMGILFAIMA